MASRLQPRPWQQAIARKQQKKLLSLIQGVDGELREAILKAARDVDKVLAQIPGDKIGVVVRRAAYQQHQAALAAISEELWADKISSTVLDSLRQSAALATQEQEAILRQFMKKAAPGRSGVLMDSFLQSARQSAGNLRSRLLNNIDLSPNVYQRAALMRGKIDDIVNSGIALGNSAREIATAVRDHINPKVMGGQRYAAMRLGRTELNNAFHTTSLQAYAESPYVEGVKWNLSGSHKQPDDCNDFAEVNEFGLGAGIFPPEQVPFKPHPQCFCYTTAITPEPEEFIRKMNRGEYNCT